jgi:cytochrome c nitrite reductase small subunit
MKGRVAMGTLVAIAIGIAMGVAGYTFIYAKGASYLTNDPKACMNCHVMQDYYDGWLQSSHRSVAVCNDCHAPHNLVGKYWTKADNGFWHSFAFTTGRFQDNIHIKGRNLRVTENACVECHAEIVSSMSPRVEGHQGATSCVRCHGSVGHPTR